MEAFKALDAPRFVLDGEIVIPDGRLPSFDELLLRIHPADSRARGGGGTEARASES